MAHAGKALYHQEHNSKVQYFQESWQPELCVHSKVIIYSFVWLFFQQIFMKCLLCQTLYQILEIE